MFKAIRRALGRQTPAELFEQFSLPPEDPCPELAALDRAANIIGHITANPKLIGQVTQSTKFAADRVASEFGFPRLIEMLEGLPNAVIIKAGTFAIDATRTIARIPGDPAVALQADCYGIVATVCFHAVNRYSDAQSQKIAGMAQDLYVAVEVDSDHDPK